jgi:hypothetical protein
MDRLIDQLVAGGACCSLCAKVLVPSAVGSVTFQGDVPTTCKVLVDPYWCSFGQRYRQLDALEAHGSSRAPT